MAKKIDGYIKLQIPAGQANPSPPVGPALGQKGVNIMEFCKAFNASTQNSEPGMPIPVEITVYVDKSFTFITKSPPTSFFIKKAVKLKKASQKWQNNMNAQEAVSLKNLKEQALMQSLMQQPGSVQPIRKVEM